LEQIFFIFFLLSLGYSLKFFDFPKNFSQSLNLFVIYVSLPATILIQIPKINFNSTFIMSVITPYVVFFISILFVYLFFKNVQKDIKASLYLLLPLGNTSFFGFPMLEALIGKEAIPYGIVYDQFGSFVLLSIYGSFVIAKFSGNHVTLNQMAKKIFIFPPFIFLFLAFIFADIPKIILPFLELLAKTLIPLAIISVGFSMSLKLQNDKNIFVKFMLIKLLIIPTIIFGIFKLIGFEGIGAITILLESAMPPMITAGALAISAGFAPKFTASIVGYGIIFGIFTLSFWKFIYLYYS
jgi:predicted permease